MYLKATLALLLFASIAVAQPPRVPQIVVDELPMPPGDTKPEIKLPSHESRTDVYQQTVPFGLFGRRSRIVYTPRLVPAEQEVRREPIPFEGLPAPRTVDDSRPRGSLPPHLPFLADLEPYTSARYTQQTFRRWSGVITSASRSTLERKWLFPGGLADVEGWTSELRKSRNATARIFLKRQDPDDGNSAVTWDRAYPDGSVFADVLRNSSGDVFEVRVAERRDGQWDRFVAYRNISARPHGYRPLASRQCASCHDQAGVSEYSQGAVPGGGGVLSEPIEPVENRHNVQGGYGTQL